MMCFRDTTFCASNCSNTSCTRHFGEDDKAAAKAWAERLGLTDGAPIAFADFSPGCNDYIAPGTVAPVLKLKEAV
jgi:hypothetical protein